MNKKRGASIISIALCFIAISLVTGALAVAVWNDMSYKMNSMALRDSVVMDSSAYIKIYTKNEIVGVARQAFADNYLTFYDGVVDLEGLEALVIGQMEETVPRAQLDNYEVIVTANGVDVI